MPGLQVYLPYHIFHTSPLFQCKQKVFILEIHLFIYFLDFFLSCFSSDLYQLPSLHKSSTFFLLALFFLNHYWNMFSLLPTLKKKKSAEKQAPFLFPQWDKLLERAIILTGWVSSFHLFLSSLHPSSNHTIDAILDQFI